MADKNIAINLGSQSQYYLSDLRGRQSGLIRTALRQERGGWEDISGAGVVPARWTYRTASDDIDPEAAGCDRRIQGHRC